MFWHVEGADGCIVDRAMQTGEKVEVEILAGVEGQNSISIIVEPLKSEESGSRARRPRDSARHFGSSPR